MLLQKLNSINADGILNQYDRGVKQAQEKSKLAALTQAGETLQNGGDLNTAAQTLLGSGNVQGFGMLAGLANQNRSHELNQAKFDHQKNALPKQTTAIQNFKYGQQNPAFFDHQKNLKRAGATNVNVAGAKGETAFQKSLGRKSGEMFVKLADDGTAAQDNAVIIDKLGQMLPESGGISAGIQGAFAKWGIGGPNMGKLQAFNSFIDRLTPQQRQGLPGAASDRDVAMFKNSLPSLWNTKGGNQIILETMSALNNAKIQRGQIANQVMTGQLNRAQAMQALRSIKDPMTVFKQFHKANRGALVKGNTNRQPNPVMQPNQPNQGGTNTGIKWSVQ